MPGIEKTNNAADREALYLEERRQNAEYRELFQYAKDLALDAKEFNTYVIGREGKLAKIKQRRINTLVALANRFCEAAGIEDDDGT